LNVGWSEEFGEAHASPERDLADEPASDEDEMVE
jgi:hypothetical protein